MPMPHQDSAVYIFRAAHSPSSSTRPLLHLHPHHCSVDPKGPCHIATTMSHISAAPVSKFTIDITMVTYTSTPDLPPHISTRHPAATRSQLSNFSFAAISSKLPKSSAAAHAYSLRSLAAASPKPSKFSFTNASSKPTKSSLTLAAAFPPKSAFHSSCKTITPMCMP